MIDLYERSILVTKQAQQRVLERGDVGEQEDEIAPAIYIQVFLLRTVIVSLFLYLLIYFSLFVSLLLSLSSIYIEISLFLRFKCISSLSSLFLDI